MSHLTRYLLRSLPTSPASKAVSSSNSGSAKKVQSASIHNIKLVELHEKLHVSKEVSPQLRGLRLHDHHSNHQAATQFPVPKSPISDFFKGREQANSQARDLEYREVHGRVRGVYNLGLKSPAALKMVRC